MMFKCAFEIDNDSFADDTETEIANTLLRIESAVRLGEKGGNIMDLNGNSIGRWTIN